MYRRIKEENDKAIRCGICGAVIGRGEPYIIAEEEYICRDCSRELELWQVLELLEIPEVIDLFAERGKTAKVG